MVNCSSSLFGKCLAAGGQAISQAEAEERMFDKLDDAAFLADVPPLLAADEAASFDGESGRAVFPTVYPLFIKRLRGDAWPHN